ncbi:MAG: aminotransferase class I/II-fold pyridoxal phosphate-dependent enzyme [Epsilonproteobacteria bacterium]|nr:aminotransferase class I/II-fold pyridoxal phosphate-dependent enzyme [Campylobacterota bacterium]
MRKIPFYRASEIKNLIEINRANFYDNLEEAPLKLESKFKELTNTNYTLSVANSSLALHLALLAIELKRGDKVVCAINSYVDVPEAIRHFDSEPIFVDIEPRSYHLDIDALKNSIKQNRSKKLRAIIVSHFAGLKQDIAKIKEIAKENNLIIIEDFTDAPITGSKIKVESDIAIFSLNYRFDNNLKGAIIGFNSEEHFKRGKLLRNHGLIYPNRELSYIYDVVDVGYDYRLDNINAFFLEKLLHQRELLLRQKREIANIYFEELKDTPHITLPIRRDDHLYSYFIIEIEKNRDAFARELISRGVEVKLHYIPLNFTSYYKKKYNLKVTSFPNALNIYQKILSLPCNGKMSKDEAKYVTKVVKEVARNHI